MLLCGCDALFGLQHVDRVDANNEDADGPPITTCYGTGMLHDVCVDTTDPVLVLTPMIDTTNDDRCVKVLQADGPVLCVMGANRIVVNAAVGVSGARPLVLIAATTIEVSELLDVSSKRAIQTGAASQGGCSSAAGSSGGMGAGGGAGGTFGFPGGNGGAGQQV